MDHARACPVLGALSLQRMQRDRKNHVLVRLELLKSRHYLRAGIAENELIWKYLSTEEGHAFFIVFL